MKTLLRKMENGLFFQGPNRWTDDPRKALNFKSIDRALNFIQTWELKEVELAFAFADENHVTCVPLDRIAATYRQE